MKTRGRKRPSVNPRLLRKAKRVSTAHSPTAQIPGGREKSANGYLIRGTACREYETFFEYIAQAQMTDTVMHPKKTRTYRVVGGRGFATLSKDDKKKSVVLLPGVELTVQPGVACSLATTSDNILEVFVSQSAKYAARMEVVKKSETTVDISPELLDSVDTGDLVKQDVQPVINRRRSSTKAAQQQTKLAQQRGRAVSSTPAAGATPAVAGSDSAFVPNLRPSYGSDLAGEPG